MDNTILERIDRKIEDFNGGKFNLSEENVLTILNKADNLKFNFKRYNDQSAEQLLMGCYCYIINNKERDRNFFNLDLYTSEYMPSEIKYRIIKNWTQHGRMPPKTLSEAFSTVYEPSEVAAYAHIVFDKLKESEETLLIPHIIYDHLNKTIDGGRVLGREKIESIFDDDIKKLALEIQEANKDKIISWLVSSETKDLILEYDFGRKIGHGIDLNFCYHDTQVGRMILCKDSENSHNEVNPLGCVAKTFFPDVLKGDMTMKRISSYELKQNFGVTHVKFPLYRTFALIKDAFYDRQDVNLHYDKIGVATMDIRTDAGIIKGSLSIFEDELQIEFVPNGSRTTTMEYTMEQLKMFDQIYGTDYCYLFSEFERCFENQKDIGDKWFDEDINEEELAEVTFNLSEER